MSFRQGIMLCGMGTRGNSGPGLASLSGPGPRFTWDHLAKQMEDLYITASSTRPCVQRRCTRKCLIKLAPIVVAGPYSGGQSHQRQPLFSTCMMPLMTRRSSTRSTPRHPSAGEVRSASIAYRSAKTGFCARSRSLFQKRIRIVLGERKI